MERDARQPQPRHRPAVDAGIDEHRTQPDRAGRVLDRKGRQQAARVQDLEEIRAFRQERLPVHEDMIVPDRAEKKRPGVQA